MKRSGIPLSKVPGAVLATTNQSYLEATLRSAAKMTPDMKFRRRVFCAHYIKTMDPVSAAAAAGFSSPNVQGRKLLKEPYVQEILSSLLRELDEDAIMSQNEILFRLKVEALDTTAGNQSARVSALSQLSKIRDMVKDKNQPPPAQQCVMVVPAMGTVDSWEQAAAAQQKSLKDSVKD